jgi:hypothetical protein
MNNNNMMQGGNFNAFNSMNQFHQRNQMNMLYNSKGNFYFKNV